MNYSDFLALLKTPLIYVLQPNSRTFILYLLTSFLIGLVVHVYTLRRQKKPMPSPFSELLPTEVYTHPSSLVDYVYFVSNTILYAVILAPFTGLGIFVSSQIQRGLSAFMEPVELIVLSPVVATVVFSLVIALVSDFGTFLGHYVMHKSPLLWEFHKVHHSAEVLNPITVYRMHPIDDIVTLTLVGSLVGAVDAAVRFFITPVASEYLLYGLSVFTLLFYLFGYNLRHSHIWVSYGERMSRVLISPAQHQIHHSKARKHWDKNYGFIFAFWDGLFGSLYVPRGYEKLEFGIGNGEERDFSSVLRLYFVPFRNVIRRVFKRRADTR
jgi:sterol desaturase/sphingolipid hydroxylase (fatty acid hydroxylase superfamily)